MIPYGRQQIEEDDIEAVVATLRGDWLTTGPAVQRFEQALAERVGAKHAVVCASGTAALHLAYAAAGLGPGGELITTPLTFSGTANMALQLGASVRFTDVRADTLNLNPEQIRCSGRTRVITAVDYAGLPSEIDALQEIAHSAGALLVEDACHALGAESDGRPIGSIADLTVFSFHPVKTITSGEGGAVVTNDSALYERVTDLRNHGIVRDRSRFSQADEGPWYYELSALGWNYRITDIQCALGLSQLSKLDRFLARRRAIARRYLAAWAADERLILPTAPDIDAHGWHLFVVRLRGKTPPRRRFFDGLRQAGLGAQVHYVPVNHHPVYRERGHDPADTPVTLDAYQRMVSLPLFPAMGDDDVEQVIGTVTRELDALYR